MRKLNDYPQPVIDRTNEFIESLEAFDAFEHFHTTPEIFGESVAQEIFKHWIEDGDLEITEDEFNGSMFRAEMESACRRMIDDGLIGELGDDMVFITEKGKEYIKDVK